MNGNTLYWDWTVLPTWMKYVLVKSRSMAQRAISSVSSLKMPSHFINIIRSVGSIPKMLGVVIRELCKSFVCESKLTASSVKLRFYIFWSFLISFTVYTTFMCRSDSDSLTILGTDLEIGSNSVAKSLDLRFTILWARSFLYSLLY